MEAWNEPGEALHQYYQILEKQPLDTPYYVKKVSQCALASHDYQLVVDNYLEHEKESGSYVLFDYILANIAIGKRQAAKDAIVEMWPETHGVWNELLASKHSNTIPLTKATDENYENAKLAYEYWDQNGRYWYEVEGALNVIRKAAEESQHRKSA